jgi:immune inhibitor A
MRFSVWTVVLGGLLWAATAGAMPPQPGPDMLAGPRARQYYLNRPDIVDAPAKATRLAASSSPRALVLLIEFQDERVWWETSSTAHFQYMLFGDNEGSLRSYFLENSYGRFDLTGYVYGWMMSDALYSDIVNRDGECGTGDDYGLDISADAIDPGKSAYPLNVWGIVAEAVNLADDAIDFSLYDNDGPDGIPDSGDDDGYVDFLFVVHPGIGAEHFSGYCDDIWSLQSDLDKYEPTQGTTADGVRIGPFVIVPELGQVGVFAHECCHLLGLPDLYNSESGEMVVGYYCLMGYGAWGGPQGHEGSVPSHLSAPMKYFLGWIDPSEICLGCESGGSVTGAEVYPAENQPLSSAYEILHNPGGADWTPRGTGSGEYFLVENRQRAVGFFDTYLPGSGLLIWRVNESEPDNNNPASRLAEVVQADGDGELPGSAADFWPGSLSKTEFTPDSEPPSSLGGDRFSGVAILNIQPGMGFRMRMDVMLGLPKRGTAYAFPNPFTPGNGNDLRIIFVRDPGPATPWDFSVDIFDIEGNFVRRLEGQGETLENGTALWDGTDEAGGEVGEGLYMYVVESTGESASGVIALRK